MQGWSHPAADGVGENRREGAASAPYLASTNGDLKRTLLRAFCLASFLEMMVGGNSSVCPALQLHVSTQWNTMRLRGGVARYPELLSEADLQERRAICAAALRQPADQCEVWIALGEIRAAQGENLEAMSVWRRGREVCPQDLRLRQLATDASLYYNPERDDGWMRMQSFAPEELESFEVPSPLNPETVEKLIHASSRPVVPPESCAWVTVEARKHFEEKGFVENGPEDFAPSSHVHVSSIPAILQWFNEFFKATGMPLLKTAFSLTLEQCTSLRIHEAVVIRYDADGPAMRGVKRHVEANDFLLTLQLNGPEEYEGGGLWIDAIRSTIVGPAGTLVAMDPKLSHAALGVEKGTRHVLAVYISMGVNKSEKNGGYTLASLGLEEASSS